MARFKPTKADITKRDWNANSVFDIVRQRLAGFLGFSHGGRRDLYEAFGYSRLMVVGDILAMYLRNDIASRIIRAFPQATWRDDITIKDDDGDSIEEKTSSGDVNDNFSPFAKEVHDFFNKFKVKSYLERADRLSSIGQYGILFMGFNDGLQPNMPLGTGKAPLLYLQAYGEQNVTISSWDLDKKSPRFGKPLLYTLSTGTVLGGGQVAHVASFAVHWSRCIHIAEFLDEDETFGTPRLLPIINRLMDLEKLVGSAAETFWLNARGGLSITADKDASLSVGGIADMKEQAEDWSNQLRRTIALQGAKAELLHAGIADPKNTADILLDLIAGAMGMPRRILTGSERGELASSQDENNWAARIGERRKNFASPFILGPFVRLMIVTGNIRPPVGEWRAEWPDATAMTALNVAQIGERKANALLKYLSAAGAEDVVPYQEFRSDFLGLPPESEYTVDEEPLDENDPEVQDGFNTGDPAKADLTGPQILAITAIVEAVGTKAIDPDTAVQLLLICLPGLTEDVAKEMVMPMLNVDPPPEPVPPQLAPPLTQDGVTPPKPVDPTPKAPVPPAPAKTPSVKIRMARAFEVMRRQGTAHRADTLYVRRDIINAEAVRAHFKAQGFDTLVPADEMHVTIAYSETPVDWMKIANDWANNTKGELTVAPGGARQMDIFGPKKNCLVLMFNCSELSWRWSQIKEAGASWKWGDYQAHITITYNFGPFTNDADRQAAMAKVEPYTGELILGPEIFETITPNAVEGITENKRTP